MKQVERHLHDFDFELSERGESCRVQSVLVHVHGERLLHELLERVILGLVHVAEDAPALGLVLLVTSHPRQDRLVAVGHGRDAGARGRGQRCGEGAGDGFARLIVDARRQGATGTGDRLQQRQTSRADTATDESGIS